MGKIEDFAALSQDPDPDVLALARVVRTVEGARRFKSAIGAFITNRPAAPGMVNTGNPSVSSRPGTDNAQIQVAALRKALSKLDASAIKGILEQLQKSKNLPHNKQYDVVKEMLEDELKNKLKKANETAKYATRNAARSARDQATGQG